MPRPVVLEREETLVALHQEEYETLPAIIGRKPLVPVTSRWTFSPEERERISKGGDLWITQITFGHLLQPIKLSTEEPCEAELLGT